MPNPLSLKQRLAVLSTLPSTPTSPYSQDPPRSPISLAAKRKIFTPPWKRQHEPALANGLGEEYGESEAVQDVMARLIFQAGVDFE
jgi:Rho GTPase-activating protein 1